MNWNTIFLVAALIAFLLDAFKTWIIPASKVNWTPLGYALVVASFLV